MKRLQKNFTTQEQSKRLLKLGVPADSADMYYHQECVRIKYGKAEFEYFLRCGKPDTNKYSTDIPCWSTGRLIEILIICNTYLAPKGIKIEPNSMNPTLIENVVNKIEELEGYDMLDFSKLN